MKRARVLLTSLAALGLACIARALEWEKREIALAAKPGDEVLRTRFVFKNTDTRTVRILGVRTSCGCTEASVNESEIAPGASGALDVLFTIGQRTGRQEKEIVVMTDDAKEPLKLTLIVQLPEKSST